VAQLQKNDVFPPNVAQLLITLIVILFVNMFQLCVVISFLCAIWCAVLFFACVFFFFPAKRGSAAYYCGSDIYCDCVSTLCCDFVSVCLIVCCFVFCICCVVFFPAKLGSAAYLKHNHNKLKQCCNFVSVCHMVCYFIFCVRFFFFFGRQMWRPHCGHTVSKRGSAAYYCRSVIFCDCVSTLCCDFVSVCHMVCYFIFCVRFFFWAAKGGPAAYCMKEVCCDCEGRMLCYDCVSANADTT